MHDIDRRDRRTALRLVGVQAAAVGLLALAGSPFGVEKALALLTGGAIGLAGSLWLAFFAFRPSGTESAKVILKGFYLGEIGKVLVVAALFVLAFQNLEWLQAPQRALLVFGGFAASQATIVLASGLLRVRG